MDPFVRFTTGEPTTVFGDPVAIDICYYCLDQHDVLRWESYSFVVILLWQPLVSC